MKKLYIEQVQNILMKSIYQYFFLTFWNIEEHNSWTTERQSYEIFNLNALIGGIPIFWQTLLRIQTILH